MNLKKSYTVWLTGLSASGKTTIARDLHNKLSDQGIGSVLLDGDDLRGTICKDLKFTLEDREENNRRAAEIAKIINKSGSIAICSFISPTNQIRESIKEIIGEDKFILVYVDTPIEICETRDKKELYSRARSGEIKEFSGISSPFEVPDQPLFILDGSISPDENSHLLLQHLISL